MGSRASAYIDDDRVYTFGGWGDLVCWSCEPRRRIDNLVKMKLMIFVGIRNK
jgi:hypothetical protein